MKSESEDYKKGLAADRKDFKNVAKNIPHFSDYNYRPVINQVERLLKISEEIKSTPSIVTNFLVDVGLECIERTIPKLKEEIKKEVNKKIKGLLQ
jgi:hypothetical protein